MRILQVAPAFPPSAFGGMSTHVGLLSTGLAARGHDVWVATTNGYDFKHAMPFSGLREVGPVRVFYARSHWPRRYFFAPEILRKLREWIPTFDVVHVHDPRSFVALAAFLVARSRPVPYVVTCHGSLSSRIGSRWLKELHDHVVGRGLVRSASRVLALNQIELREIVKFGVAPDRVNIVPNAIPPKQNGTFAATLEPRNNEPGLRTILYLGRIHRIKGIDRLINAFALTVARSPDCRLLVVGQDYGAQQRLEKMVHDLGLAGKVFFPGPKYGHEKELLMQMADVLVLPSHVETFPMVVLEAFAEGVPVVTTVGCGIADELTENQAALVVSSTAEMSMAIERCLTEPDVAEQLRRNGLRMLQTTYNWERVLDRISNIYREVAP